MFWSRNRCFLSEVKIELLVYFEARTDDICRRGLKKNALILELVRLNMKRVYVVGSALEV